MNQRTTVPPFGPGPTGMGSGVMIRGVAVGAGVGVAALPVDGATVAAGLQAVAMSAMTPSRVTSTLGTDLGLVIVFDSSSARPGSVSTS